MRSIPSTQGLPQQVATVVGAIKENLETITGRRVDKLERIPEGTTDLAVIVAAINGIIDRLQT